MGIRVTRMAGICGLMAVGILGCSRWSRDHSKVLANAGGEKITEKAFTESVYALAGDEAKAKDVLTKEDSRELRNRLLESMAMQKCLLKFAKGEGLDRDPKVKNLVEQATMRVYLQAIMEKRTSKAEPTEAQLKTLYDDLVAERKKMGQAEGLPSFDQAKPELPRLWQQKQQQAVGEAFEKELKQKYQVTYAEGYKPPVQP